jgi:hypothetical protein
MGYIFVHGLLRERIVVWLGAIGVSPRFEV